MQLSEAEQLKQTFAAVMVEQSRQFPVLPTRQQIDMFGLSVPHISEAAVTLINWLEDDDVIMPYVSVARFYEGQMDYEQALSWKARCIDVAQRKLGSDHLDVSASFTNLAELFRKCGQYDEAERCYLRSFAIVESQLGTCSSRIQPLLTYVAATSEGLANLYYEQGRYDQETELLYQNALTIWTQELGEKHPLVATGLHNLACLSLAKNYGENAVSLCQQSLQIREQSLGECHPETVSSLSLLAQIYQSQERLDDAEAIHLRVMESNKYLLGEEHPHVASDLNNLASLYLQQKQYEKSELLFSQALELQRKILGDKHPQVVKTLNNLAVLYLHQERFVEAETLLVDLLRASEQQLDPDHPNLATILHNLAKLYHLQGHYDEAEPLYLRTLEIFSEKLGESHGSTQIAQQDFLLFLQQVLWERRTKELSDDPLTRSMLEVLAWN